MFASEQDICGKPSRLMKKLAKMGFKKKSGSRVQTKTLRYKRKVGVYANFSWPIYKPYKSPRLRIEFDPLKEYIERSKTALCKRLDERGS